METTKPHMGITPASTSQHWTAYRTEDDIVATVNDFLKNESHRVKGKTWQEIAEDVGQWLGSQIQKEREGWAHKIRMAMQEIETNRKETLRFQSIIQECADQMRLVAECCSVDEAVIQKIGKNEARHSLPMYIELLAEVLNALIEDKILALQLLHVQEPNAGASLPNALKSHLEKLHHSNEKSHADAKNRIVSLENANKQCYLEIQKLRKIIVKKQDDMDKLHEKLQEIKDITFRKYKEVKQLKAGETKSQDSESQFSERDMMKEKVPAPITDRSTPSSHYSAPTPIPMDETGIKISEEKLSRLRKSAKKLENSLQDALSQMDSYRKTAKPTKYHASIFGGKLVPFSLMSVADVPPSLRKDMKLLPSPLHTWNVGKFEVSSTQNPKERLKEKLKERKEKAKEKRRAKEKANKSNTDRQSTATKEEAPTFRSLVQSLDQLKHRSTNRTRNKTGGQVTKCLRCNKLFTLNDNHKKACCYHPKGKERIEQYSDRGKLTKVTYLWKCCMLGPDAPGCTYGQHM